MELRKDPITRSWVVIGDPGPAPEIGEKCPFCPENQDSQASILTLPAEGPWQVRVLSHRDPLYHIEGEVGRQAEGIYDKMRAVGAHEVIVETSRHDVRLSQMTDAEIENVLAAYAQRIIDLKGDLRFKYVNISKDQGAVADEWAHSHSQVMATTFVPRRILYELRAARAWYADKERCVFCDIVHQEEKRGTRMIDNEGDYVALCPYASRVPYETWVMSRKHNHLFENARGDGRSNRRQLAALLGRLLRRVEKVSQGYHMVVHTAPNTARTKSELAEYWTTIAEDYHWHIEVLPVLEQSHKSYNLKEVYLNPLEPEIAAKRLREADSSR
ncbi:MAG TPA: hypothetical protein VFO34_08480 [Candidatus Acidoferrales bacterium]|nr:hypothetical protein [Candidatus Acidoferrales bacterium]